MRTVGSLHHLVDAEKASRGLDRSDACLPKSGGHEGQDDITEEPRRPLRLQQHQRCDHDQQNLQGQLGIDRKPHLKQHAKRDDRGRRDQRCRSLLHEAPSAAGEHSWHRQKGGRNQDGVLINVVEDVWRDKSCEHAAEHSAERRP